MTGVAWMLDGGTSEDIQMPEQRQAVIIAAVRSGGTFLSECLSNHTQVHCVRGEPMHKRSVWRRAMPDSPVVLLNCVLHQAHYRVSMCKLTYGQAFHERVWRYLTELQPLTIWLRRENVLRQAVSVILVKLRNKGVVDRPVHSTERLGPVGITLDPEVVLEHMRGLTQGDQEAREQMQAFTRRLDLTYADVVGGEDQNTSSLSEDVTARLCAFLGVRQERMGADLVRVNPQPLREMFYNWSEIEEAVRESGFARWLEDERC